MVTPSALESGLAKLADAFDAAYEAEWERVAEIAEGAGASGVADRAATIAGIRAVHAALLAKLDAADKVAAALDVLYDEAERFSVSGVYFAEEWFEHKGLKLADEALAAYRNPAPAAEGE